MEIVARATFMFFFPFLLTRGMKTRGMKKRALADMAPFEMLLLVVLGDIVQQGITQEDFSLTGAVLAASTFGSWGLGADLPDVEIPPDRPPPRWGATGDRPGRPPHRPGAGRRAHAAVLEPSGRVSFIATDS